MLRETDMPAVLLELGFMDSTTDVPIILTNEYAQNCAKAIVEVLVARGGLKKKTGKTEAQYKVQVGAFSQQENAKKAAERAGRKRLCELHRSGVKIRKPSHH